MNLERLTIHRMPGISDRFTVEAASGLNLITGPNGSGKTTVCRAVRALLWPSTETRGHLEVESRWTIGGASFVATREGRGATRWRDADGQPLEPPALPARHLARCYTLDLHDFFRREDRATDHAIATEILRQMTGGYDLEAVVQKHFPGSAQAGWNEQREFVRRESKLGALRVEQRKLADQAASLEARERALERARTAGEHLELFARRKDELETRAALDGASVVVASFTSEKIDRLTGKEIEELDDLEERIEAIRTEQRVCERDIDQARKDVDDADLRGHPVASTELAAAKARAAKLAALESELRQAGKDEARAAEVLERTGRELDPAWDVRRAPDIDLKTIREAEAYCRRVTDLECRIEAHDRILDHELLALETPDPKPAVLERAVRALEGWRDATAGRRRWPLLASGAALAGAAAAAAMVLGVPGDTLAWLLLGVIVLSAASGVWLVLTVAARDRRTAAEHRAQFERTGLAPPAAWEITAGQERLEALRETLLRARTDRIRAELRAGFVAGRRGLARERQGELTEERAALLKRTGAAPEARAIDIVEFARRVHDFAEAGRNLDACRESRRQVEGEIDALKEDLNRFCREHGYPDAKDAASAAANVEALAGRVQSQKTAQAFLDREVPRLERSAERLAELERKRAELFRELDLEPGDRAGLVARLRRRPDYLEASDVHRELRTQLDLQRTSLEGHPRFAEHPDLRTLGIAEVERRIERLGSEAAGADAMDDEIRDIRARVRLAEENHAVEEARADVEAAREALAQKREDALGSEAGRFLLEGVRDRHEAATRPAVEVRASDLFATFTNRAYLLRVKRVDGGTAAFRAIDTRTNTPLGLDQLSDGTRAQLLLAARLAFAFEVERDVRPPLFLDEALSTSDPVRFHAIARSLVKLIGEHGRQVFYLTANPTDVLLWNRTLEERGQDAITPFDLAEGRRKEVAAGSDELSVAPLPSIPDPTGLDAEAYGRALRVERFDPRRDADSVHLFHLLFDDLELLHRLLGNRIETVGQWRSFAEQVVRSREIDAETAGRIHARADLVAAFITAWRRGRGKPVNREVLEASDAVSDTFIDEVADLAAELQGASRPLVQALEQGQVKKFRRAAVDRLQDYLLEAGYIDSRPKFDENGIRTTVLDAVTNHLTKETLKPDQVAALVHRLWSLTR